MLAKLVSDCRAAATLSKRVLWTWSRVWGALSSGVAFPRYIYMYICGIEIRPEKSAGRMVLHTRNGTNHHKNHLTIFQKKILMIGKFNHVAIVVPDIDVARVM